MLAMMLALALQAQTAPGQSAKAREDAMNLALADADKATDEAIATAEKAAVRASAFELGGNCT